ncbi:MAG: hypothetical protein ACOY0T_02620 [Myxococcota bacterium]
MAYAVTCKSCGARFSVANDLVQKRMGGEPIALRCKRCREPIRVTASQPPQPLPSPGAPHGVPRPPLKKQPPKPPTPQAAQPARPTPPRAPSKRGIVALAPGLLPERSGVEHDLFEPPPDSQPGAVDLSELAHSEPPSRLSSAPPLFDLTHTGPVKSDTSTEDVDFLLGLQGSPGTTAALQSPSLADLMKKAESEPPLPIHVEEPTETPAAIAVPKAPAVPQIEPDERPRRRFAITLAVAALAVGAVVMAKGSFSGSSAKPESTPQAATIPSPRVASPTLSSAPAAPEPIPTASTPAAAASVKPAPVARSAKAVSSSSKTATTPTTAAAAEPPAKAPRAAATPVEREPVGAGFDRAAAASALATQAAQASACRKPGDPSGTAAVTITFAPSGRVTSANISGPPFAGTATGGCIAAALRRTRIPAFDGNNVTVSKTVTIQ